MDSASGVPAGRLSVVVAGPITFSGSIGSLNQLVSLDVSGGGLTTINDTLNIQSADFHNNTLLGSNLHLTNGQYTFRQKLNSGPGGPSRWNTAGVSTLAAGAVGGDSELASIDAGSSADGAGVERDGGELHPVRGDPSGWIEHRDKPLARSSSGDHLAHVAC